VKKAITQTTWNTRKQSSMKSIEITDIHELKAATARLRMLQVEQKAALQQRLNSPAAIFSSLMTVFPKKTSENRNAGPSILHPDFLRMISRVVIPFTLNKTLFKRSNFLVKMLVSLVSQKAAGLVSKPVAESLLTKFKAVFKNLTRKKHNSKVPTVITPMSPLSIN